MTPTDSILQHFGQLADSTLLHLKLLSKANDGWGWVAIHALLFIVAFLSPIIYQLLNFASDNMMRIDERKNYLWGRDRESQKLQWQIKGWFIFSDYVNIDITLNALFLLLMTITINDTGMRLWQKTWWPSLWIFLLIKFVIYLITTSILRKSRLGNLMALLFSKGQPKKVTRYCTDNLKPPSVIWRSWCFLILFIILFISPVCLFLSKVSAMQIFGRDLGFLGNSEILRVAIVLVIFIFIWLSSTIIWTPVSALHMLKGHQDKVLDLGKQQRFSFENNAESYAIDDKYRLIFMNRISQKIHNHFADINGEKKILYAGCGSSDLLVRLAKLLNPPTRREKYKIFAIDSSPAMLKSAENILRGPLGIPENKNNIYLMHGDFLDNELFPSEHFHAILCLNNTLGNLIDKDIPSALRCRNKSLALFNALLKDDGIFILTVYNGRHPCSCETEYPKRAKEYSERMECVYDLSSPATNDWVFKLNLGQRGIDSSLFYSHWFTESEIKELLERHGFSNMDGKPNIEVDIVKDNVLMAVGLKKK